MEGLFVLLLAGVSFLAAIGSLVVASAGRGWVARQTPSGTGAQEILDERLARGQIDLPDYLARSAALRGEWANGTEYRPTEPSDDDLTEPEFPPGDPVARPRRATPHPGRRPPILEDRPLIHVMPGLIEPPRPPEHS